MKRLFLAIPLLFFLFSFFFILPNRVAASTVCPTDNIQCGELDAGGGCDDPCLRIVTTVGTRGPSWCACQEPQNIPDGSLSCGETCQTHTNCDSSCPFCRANGPGTAMTCSAATVPVGPVSRFCNGLNEDDGINTAIGCIKVGSGNDLVNTILRLALGVGGGLALALILYGTFIVTTSAGIPDKLKAGGEIITSAIIGLIFILLSIFLVNLIGINILGIPGFLQ